MSYWNIVEVIPSDIALLLVLRVHLFSLQNEMWIYAKLCQICMQLTAYMSAVPQLNVCRNWTIMKKMKNYDKMKFNK